MHTTLVLTTRLASLLALGMAQSAGNIAYYNPTLGGGSMLEDAGYGYGEPLNVRLSPVSSCGDHYS